MPSRDDLAAIMRLKLKSLTDNGMINSEFRAVIEKISDTKKKHESDRLAEILDQIALTLKKKECGEIQLSHL
ncbi:MAG: hypothetical protein ACLTW9_24710 [Enterocloster sp.]